MNKLEKAREIINDIDKQMCQLYEIRIHAVRDIIDYKIRHNLPIFDESREIEVIKTNLENLSDQNLKVFYKEFLQAVMDNSKLYQKAILDKKIL